MLTRPIKASAILAALLLGESVIACPVAAPTESAEAIEEGFTVPAFFDCIATQKDPGAAGLPPAPPTQIDEATAQVNLGAYRTHVAAARDRLPGSATQGRAVLDRLLQRYDLALDAVASRLSVSDNLTSHHYWPAQLDSTLPLKAPVNPTGLPTLLLAEIVNESCGSGKPTAGCQFAIEATSMAARAVKLTGQTLHGTIYNTVRQRYAEDLARHARWESYLADALPLYPWEMYANHVVKNWGVKECAGQPNPGDDCVTDLRAPRNWQLLFLHLDAAMEYVDGAPDGDAFNPAVLLEVLGYNRFRFDESNKVNGGFGISAGILYADRAGLTDLRAAITIHVRNKYAGGLSFGSDEIGVFVNIPLSEKVRATYKDYKEIIEGR